MKIKTTVFYIIDDLLTAAPRIQPFSHALCPMEQHYKALTKLSDLLKATVSFSNVTCDTVLDLVNQYVLKLKENNNWARKLIQINKNQATCQWGRDTIESWGRKRRNVETLEKSEEDMTLSQEILVLDFGDDEAKLSNRQTATLPANFPNNSKKFKL